MNATTTQKIASKTTLLFIAYFFAMVSALAISPSTNTGDENGSFQYTITVKTTEQLVLLNWNTVSNISNSYFEIERSADKVEFKTVAIVLDGFEKEGAGKSYAFKESINVIQNGQAAYYRLKEINEKGIATYSAIIKVQ